MPIPTGTYVIGGLTPGATVNVDVRATGAGAAVGPETDLGNVTVAGASGGTVAPAAYMAEMEPWYHIVGQGDQTFDGAERFTTGDALVFSLPGTPPAGVSINSATGQVTVSTASALDWTTLTIRASNGLGSAEVTIRIRVVSPTATVTAGNAISSVAAGNRARVVVRAQTYTAILNLSSGWNDSEIMAWPGEDVVFDASAETGDRIITIGAASGLTLRGLRFVDNGHQCDFAFYGSTATDITVEQCWFTGFRRGAFSCGYQNRDAARPWTIAWNRIWNICWENRNPDGSGGALGAGGWGRGFFGDLADNSHIHHNWSWENWGEGLGILASAHVLVEDNFVWDNWSVDIYLDNVYGDSTNPVRVRRNYVGGTNPLFDRTGNQTGILLGNENYGAGSPYMAIPGTDWVLIEDNFVQQDRTPTNDFQQSGAPSGPGANSDGYDAATFAGAGNTTIVNWPAGLQDARNVSPWG